MIWWFIALALAAVAAIPVIRERQRRPMDATAQAEAPGEIVPLSQGKTHCRWAGRTRGPVAVCIHGLTTPSPAWDALVPHLEQLGFRVLVYDLYGRGYSDTVRGQQSPRYFVTQMRDVLDHYQLTEDVTLIGYSMGAIIAAGMAADDPSRFRQVALVAPAGMGIALSPQQKTAMEWPWIGDWLFHMGFPKRHAAAIEAMPAPEEIRAVQRAELGRRGFVGAVLSSLRHALRQPAPRIHQALAKTGIPVLAVWGDDDRVIPLSGLGQLAQWNRSARQEVIEGADHGLPFTHAKALAEILSRLMEDVRVRSSKPPE